MRTVVTASWLMLLMLILLLAGCSDSATVDAKTQVTLRIQSSDAELLRKTTELRIALSRRDANGWIPVDQTTVSSGLRWPLEIPILPRSQAAVQKPFEVVVDALAAGVRLAQARMITSFVPNSLRLLEIELRSCVGGRAGSACEVDGCHGETCMTCGPATSCQPVTVVRPTDLGIFDPKQVVSLERPGDDAAEPGPLNDAGEPFGLPDAGYAQDASPSVGVPSDGGVLSAGDAALSAVDGGKRPTCASAMCAANAHCISDNPVQCECDPGFIASGAGGCANIDDCRSNPCGPANSCLDGLNDYSCTCLTGYVQTDAKHCALQLASISAGGSHTCARRPDNSLVCWGFNGDGQLGNATGNTAAMLVAGAMNVLEVALGERHTCARHSDGSVSCWGANLYGELGNGTTAKSEVPVKVFSLTDATDIAVGARISCAVRAGGSVVCWGINGNGSLGDGTKTSSSVPVVALGLANAVEVVLSDEAACARRMDGSVYCWGNNGSHLLGNPNLTESPTPVAIAGLSGVAEIKAGARHVCVRLGAGTVSCWGDNAAAQLGYAATGYADTPTAISGLTDVAELAPGGTHTCARLKNGSVTCWGGNMYGQLGTSAGVTRGARSAVVGIAGAVEVLSGTAHACARLANGTGLCWGDNAYGQVGTNRAAGLMAAMPVLVTGF